MKILIVDTATNLFSMAIAENKTVLATCGGDAGPATSAGIPVKIATLLADCRLAIDDLDAFAVTVGPGAFTGLRVGLALVKGMAYATGKPVIPLSSLELLALNGRDSTVPVCPLYDARKGEVYSSLYSFVNGLTPLRPEMAISPESLLAELEGPVLFLGDGAVRYRELIVERLGERAAFAAGAMNRPDAAVAAPLVQDRLHSGATLSPFELLPRYLRLSEAELSKKA